MAISGENLNSDFGPALKGMTEESLQHFHKLLDRLPGEDATEEEIDAFMDEVMATGAGPDLIKELAAGFAGEGHLSRALEDEGSSDYVRPVSSARMIFRVELLGIRPAIWRQLSLPADLSFFDLHVAIQDSFGWLGVGEHQFQVREEGRIEVVFKRNPVREEFDEITSPVSEVALNGVSQFHYLYGSDESWHHLVSLEGMAQGEFQAPEPQILSGAGLCPPEGVGGPAGFREFLEGNHPLVQEYGPELVARIREGEFDPGAVRFRDARELL